MRRRARRRRFVGQDDGALGVEDHVQLLARRRHRRLAVVARFGDQHAAAGVAGLDADEIALEGDVGDLDGNRVLAVDRLASTSRACSGRT